MILSANSGDLAAAAVVASVYKVTALADAIGEIGGLRALLLWSQRRPVVRRAEEFMRAHLSEPIALHEICAAARASERTVQYGFREMYGMGAKKFLQVLRLNHARRLFRSSQGAAFSVQDGATAAGFWHMGHFSANYRRLFGETPSDTLRRYYQS